MRRAEWAASGAAAAAAMLLLLLATAAPRQTAAALLVAPLNVQAVLNAVKQHITNWPQFAAANNLTGWGADLAMPPCLYTGVTCDAEGALQSLALACPDCRVQASGTLAPELAGSPTLATINLQNNNLSGLLPPQYGATGALPSLLHLIVMSNQLTGSIPGEWSNPDAFPSLSLLSISNNRLTGTLPANLLMPSLLILRASNSKLSGPLPVDLGSNASMPHLRVASLQRNAFTGALPPEWGTSGAMSELEELYLQGNRLTGGLPPEWGADKPGGLPLMRALNLSGNPLGGTLPQQWGGQRSFPALKTMALSNTGLEGTLPAGWNCKDPSSCGLASLQTLWLDGNNLSGPVPSSWASLPGLQAIFVQPGNQLLCTMADSQLCDAQAESCLRSADPAGCAAAAIDCASPATLPVCPASQAWPPAAEAPAVAGDGAAPAAATAGGGGGGSGASVGAVVGGVIGGVAAAAAALAVALLLWRRRRRRQRRKRELPFHSSDQASKSSQDASPFDSLQSMPGGALASGLPEARPDGGAPGLLSPFAAMTAGFDPSGRHAANGALLDGPQSQPSPASAGSFLRLVMGVEARPATADNSPINNSILDAEVDRHMENLSVELAVLQPTGSGSAAQRTSSPSHSPSAQGGGSAFWPPSKTTSANSRTLAWEDSVPLSDWLITPSEISICKRPDGSDWELGSGGFGKVYKALRHGAQPVAIKVLAAVGDSSRYQSQEDFKREIAILRACRDPNIVAFLGASLQGDRTMLVTEYCDGGNLTRNLMAGRVSWCRRGKRIALDVARGLTYLHSRRIIHFDLKSPNILLARDGTAKVSDVGMAKIMAREYSGITGNVGTLAWAAPEMLLGARCTEKADIYSFGVVLWEICTAQTPIRGQLRDVRVPAECPQEVRELILDCLATNPRKRPSAVEIVERLLAMPDPRPPVGHPAAAQHARRQQAARPYSSRPPSAVAAAQPAGAGAAGVGAGGQAGRQEAAGSGSSRRQLPGSQRSSEESTVLLAEGEAEGAQLAAAAAYASPVPGSLAGRVAAAALQAARTDAPGRIHRAASILLGAPPQQHPNSLGRQPARPPLPALERASSSPDLGGLWPGSPGGLQPPDAAAGRGAAALEAGASAARQLAGGLRPAPLQQQRSLDDTPRQLAELRNAMLHASWDQGSPSRSAQQRRSLQRTGSAPARPQPRLVRQLSSLQNSLLRQSGAASPAGQPSPGSPQPELSGFQEEAQGEASLALSSQGRQQQQDEAEAVQQLAGQEAGDPRQLAWEQWRQRSSLAQQQWRQQQELTSQQLAHQAKLGATQLGERRRLEAHQLERRRGLEAPPGRGDLAPDGPGSDCRSGSLRLQPGPGRHEAAAAPEEHAPLSDAAEPTSTFALVAAYLGRAPEPATSRFISPFANATAAEEAAGGGSTGDGPASLLLQSQLSGRSTALGPTPSHRSSGTSQALETPPQPPSQLRRTSAAQEPSAPQQMQQAPSLASPFDNT